MQPRVQILAAAASATMIALSLTACQSSSANCSGTSCNVTLGGKGSSITLPTTHVRAPYNSFIIGYGGTTAGAATLKIRGATGTCTQGQSITLAQLYLTCSSVKADEVKFSITAG